MIPLQRPTEMSGIAPLIWHTELAPEPQDQPTLDRTLQKCPGEPPASALPSSPGQEPAWSPHTSFM